MRSRLQAACVSLSLTCLWSAAGAEPALDLALVLAVDASTSMTETEQELQRSGFVEAFHAPAVHQAIGRGRWAASRWPMWNGRGPTSNSFSCPGW